MCLPSKYMLNFFRWSVFTKCFFPRAADWHGVNLLHSPESCRRTFAALWKDSFELVTRRLATPVGFCFLIVPRTVFAAIGWVLANFGTIRWCWNRQRGPGHSHFHCLLSLGWVWWVTSRFTSGETSLILFAHPFAVHFGHVEQFIQ